MSLPQRTRHSFKKAKTEVQSTYVGKIFHVSIKVVYACSVCGFFQSTFLLSIHIFLLSVLHSCQQKQNVKNYMFAWRKCWKIHWNSKPIIGLEGFVWIDFFSEAELQENSRSVRECGCEDDIIFELISRNKLLPWNFLNGYLKNMKIMWMSSSLWSLIQVKCPCQRLHLILLTNTALPHKNKKLYFQYILPSVLITSNRRRKTGRIWEVQLTLTENHSSLVNTYHNISLAYNKMGDYAKALEFYEKAQDIKE